MEENNKLYSLIEGVIGEINVKNALIENTYYENKKLTLVNKELENKLTEISKEFNDYKSTMSVSNNPVKLEIEELSEDTNNLLEVIKNRDALLLATTEN